MNLQYRLKRLESHSEREVREVATEVLDLLQTLSDVHTFASSFINVAKYGHAFTHNARQQELKL